MLELGAGSVVKFYRWFIGFIERLLRIKELVLAFSGGFIKALQSCIKV